MGCHRGSPSRGHGCLTVGSVVQESKVGGISTSLEVLHALFVAWRGVEWPWGEGLHRLNESLGRSWSENIRKKFFKDFRLSLGGFWVSECVDPPPLEIVYENLWRSCMNAHKNPISCVFVFAWSVLRIHVAFFCNDSSNNKILQIPYTWSYPPPEPFVPLVITPWSLDPV